MIILGLYLYTYLIRSIQLGMVLIPNLASIIPTSIGSHTILSYGSFDLIS
jgi:hypothetical protein